MHPYFFDFLIFFVVGSFIISNYKIMKNSFKYEKKKKKLSNQ